jgi:hypothetical protein
MSSAATREQQTHHQERRKDWPHSRPPVAEGIEHHQAVLRTQLDAIKQEFSKSEFKLTKRLFVVNATLFRRPQRFGSNSGSPKVIILLPVGFPARPFCPPLLESIQH